jgi:hypothetical protein
MTDQLKTEWELRADLEAEERRVALLDQVEAMRGADVIEGMCDVLDAAEAIRGKMSLSGPEIIALDRALVRAGRP